jgi:tetratricopeptide (TPR) repeat protein
MDLSARYDRLGPIARGGMASVWAARDRKLDRKVAVKLLAEPYARDETAVRRFKREGRAAARLSSHSNVVTIYDVGQRPPSDRAPFGRPYIVMEFLPGGTVADALRAGPVPHDEVVRWLHDAAAALDYAHRHGVVHRDIKLSNFLLDEHRALHVADFGIASLGTEDTLTATGQLLGTAAYLAPEQALGQPATESSDLYSLAIAAFEMLVGERPFSGDHAAVLARQHIEAEPPHASTRNRNLPRALDAVLERGMAKRREQRWPTAQAFADAVEGALAGRRHRRPAAAPATIKTAGRRRPAAALAALAAAALVAGVAAGESSTGGSRPARALAGRQGTAHPPPPVSRAVKRPPHHASAPTPPVTASSATPTPAPTADALETRGHALMTDGNYAGAIPVLRQAVASASPGSLTYAYALYDLGRSLRLSGDPRAAIPILWRRLAIPNQTGTVRAELQMAMRAAGQSRSTGGTPPAPPDKRAAHHHDHGSSGGAAPQGD